MSLFFHPETLDIRTMDYISIMSSGCAFQTVLKVVGFCIGNGVPQARSSPDLGFQRTSCLFLKRPCLQSLSLGVCCPLVVQWGSTVDTW